MTQPDAAQRMRSLPQPSAPSADTVPACRRLLNDHADIADKREVLRRLEVELALEERSHPKPDGDRQMN